MNAFEKPPVLPEDKKEAPQLESIAYPIFDPAAAKALQEKLEDYKGREQTAHTRYGAALIEELLTKGKTDQSIVWDLTAKDLAEGREFDTEAFANVFLVIKDYAENAGKNVDGGTGFEREKHLPFRERILKAETLEEICAVIESVGGLEGSQKVYSSDELNTLIRDAEVAVRTLGVDASSMIINKITNTWGLRDRVREILSRLDQEEKTRLAA